MTIISLPSNTMITKELDEFMENNFEISSSLQSLLDHIEEQLGTTIHLSRKQ